jgi:hypothetical protein
VPNQSQPDINAFFCLVAQRVAASPRVGLADPDFKSTAEIKSEIRAHHSDLLSLLEAFFVAYQSWHDVHVEIEASGAPGSLSSELDAKLQDAIAVRDNTRHRLLSAIAT